MMKVYFRIDLLSICLICISGRTSGPKVSLRAEAGLTEYFGIVS